MSKKTSTERQLTRRQHARHERDARTQQLITWIAIVIGVAIVGLLAYGATSEIIRARKPVATIADDTITAKDFRSRQSYERWMAELEIYQYQNYLAQLNQTQPETLTAEGGEETIADGGTDALIQQLQYTLATLEQQLSPDFADLFANQVLDAMIEEKLVRTEATARAITTTEEEVQLQIELTLGYDREAAAASAAAAETITDTTSATAPQQPTFDELYEQFDTNVLRVTRFPERQFREMISAQVLSTKLGQAMSEGAETVEDQVELTVFSVETAEEGISLQSRINDEGEDPAVIVEELAQDENPLSAGYSLPWLPVGYVSTQFGPEVQKVAFDTAVGRASQPVMGTGEQLFVVYVSGHEERELTPDLLAQMEQDAYRQWLNDAKDELVEYQDWESAVVTE